MYGTQASGGCFGVGAGESTTVACGFGRKNRKRNRVHAVNKLSLWPEFSGNLGSSADSFAFSVGQTAPFTVDRILRKQQTISRSYALKPKPISPTTVTASATATHTFVFHHSSSPKITATVFYSPAKPKLLNAHLTTNSSSKEPKPLPSPSPPSLPPPEIPRSPPRTLTLLLQPNTLSSDRSSTSKPPTRTSSSWSRSATGTASSAAAERSPPGSSVSTPASTTTSAPFKQQFGLQRILVITTTWHHLLAEVVLQFISIMRAIPSASKQLQRLQVARVRKAVQLAEEDLDSLISAYQKELGMRKLELLTVSGITHLIELPVDIKVPTNWAKVSNTKKMIRYHLPEVLTGLDRLSLATEELTILCQAAWDGFMRDFAKYYAEI
ncbi:hypothetical protein Tsubulata_015551 [Turnera subulata]|uniref:Uncharacterized protein n=1 Tax=Turnera subulata TaxID=218843 RepID=A0A9Q0FD81_9ROSI|nr:hypothetical protein Tsubulata_015551 [Turnera subulata]